MKGSDRSEGMPRMAPLADSREVFGFRHVHLTPNLHYEERNEEGVKIRRYQLLMDFGKGLEQKVVAVFVDGEGYVAGDIKEPRVKRIISRFFPEKLAGNGEEKGGWTRVPTEFLEYL